MATKVNPTSPLPRTKIGPLVREIKADMVKGWTTKNVQLIRETSVKYEALKKLVSEIRAAHDTFYDNLAEARKVGEDTSWANGIERMVKLSPDVKHGRPSKAKVDPADMV